LFMPIKATHKQDKKCKKENYRKRKKSL